MSDVDIYVCEGDIIMDEFILNLQPIHIFIIWFSSSSMSSNTSFNYFNYECIIFIPKVYIQFTIFFAIQIKFYVQWKLFKLYHKNNITKTVDGSWGARVRERKIIASIFFLFQKIRNKYFN